MPRTTDRLPFPYRPETAIVAQRLAALQGGLKCGTNCGSCIPELRRLVRATPQGLQAA